MTPREWNGVWVSDAFGEMTLTQQDDTVHGTYTGKGGGTLQGVVNNERLDFTWQEQASLDVRMGWGFVRAIAGGRTLVGFWWNGDDEEHKESILAEILMRGREEDENAPRPDSILPPSDPASTDRMEIKYAGYDLVLQGRYDAALPLLEQALTTYRVQYDQHEQAASIMVDSDLIDIVNIIQRLLKCYFELADYRSVSETGSTVQRRKSFYEKLLEHLNIAVVIYQTVVRKTIQRYTIQLLQEIDKSVETLHYWHEQLTTRAIVLQQNQSAESYIYMLTLADLLSNHLEHVETARHYFAELNAHPPFKPNVIQPVLVELTNMVQSLHHQCMVDIEKIQAMEKDVPEDKREFMQGLSLLLSMLPLHLEGKHRLIEQAEKDIDGRIEFVIQGPERLSQWLERWRVRLAEDMDRIEAQELGQPFFAQLIQFFLELGSDADALVVSERARARAFIDLLAARAAMREGLSVQASEQSGINVPPVTMDELLEIVRRRQSVTIEYFVATDKLFIWVISSHGDIATFVSPISQSRLKTVVQSLLDLFQRNKLDGGQRANVSTLLQELYRYLIAPIPRELLPASEEETITIIPHNILLRLPFAALQERANTHFIQQHALVYAPSLHLLKYTERNRQDSINVENPNLLAFVNPAPFADPTLPALTFTEQAFTAIEAFYAQSMHNTILKGKYATKKALRQQAAQHSVLHFATHAQAFDEDPLASYLSLACIPPEENGYLRVPEIFQLELRTDLVILLACETGAGKVTGDGINGLSRAFIAAGTPSLLMSLWPIPELSSFDQIYLFYTYWRTERHSKAQALRLAQLEALENHPEEPAIWSVFALVGE